MSSLTHPPAQEDELTAALEQDMFGDELQYQHRPAPWTSPHVGDSSARRPPIASDFFGQDWEEPRRSAPLKQNLTADDTALGTSRTAINRMLPGPMKRSRDKFEGADNNNTSRTLSDKGAVAVMLYRNAVPDPEANDIWPEFRSTAKLPVRYCLINKDSQLPPISRTKRRQSNGAQKRASDDKQVDDEDDKLVYIPAGRPKWDLPVELVELIAEYLDRDDIKSLRMVSHELNHYISQVIFQTVVVPFNTEIYGMLAQGQKPDLKGKRRARREKLGYSWKNANGNEVYNGHGLDVFKGFGRHILRYGMSFEVNEDSLSQPPAKSLTEKKWSFWGNYDWPFEEYRRFDAVAGLETAADETPRMKIAFAELTRIKELALSIDSGLGWLRSIYSCSNSAPTSGRLRLAEERPRPPFASPARALATHRSTSSDCRRRHQTGDALPTRWNKALV
jgi:hypothetical protein